MQGILKPSGSQLENSAEIAETALREGIVGGKENMLKKTYDLLQKGGKDIGDIISKYKNKEIDLNTVFSDIKELRKTKEFAQNPEKVAAIDKLIEGFTPAFKEPKVIKSYRTTGGTFDPITAEFTPSGKFVKQTKIVNRPVTVGEAEARKVAQYQDLAEGGAFPQEAKSMDVLGRKAYARGFKKAIENVAPEVRPANERFGALSEVSEALEKRLPVEQRQNLLGLGDIILGAAGTLNPSALAAGLTRKALQWSPITSRIARGAYNVGKTRPTSALAIPLLRYANDQGE
jgi:hypothetical protein